MAVSLSLSFCVSAFHHLSVYLSAYVCRNVCLSVVLSVRLFVRLPRPVYPSLSLSLSLEFETVRDLGRFEPFFFA